MMYGDSDGWTTSGRGRDEGYWRYAGCLRLLEAK